MKNSTLATLVVTLALLPTAIAHTPAGTPNPACVWNENPHDYTAPSDTSVGGRGFGILTVTDACATGTDGDFETGIGGAFLPDSHHSSDICVDDVVLGSLVRYSVGADRNGDGAIIPATGDDWLGNVSGCNFANFTAGQDGGWWVFVHSPATAGHVTTL